MTRNVFAFDMPPLYEDVFREPYRVTDIGFDQPPTGIIVRPLPVFLKLLKGSDHVTQFPFDGRGILLVSMAPFVDRACKATGCDP